MTCPSCFNPHAGTYQWQCHKCRVRFLTRVLNVQGEATVGGYLSVWGNRYGDLTETRNEMRRIAEERRAMRRAALRAAA